VNTVLPEYRSTVIPITRHFGLSPSNGTSFDLTLTHLNPYAKR
jgi:hypothetical protein